MRRQPRPEVTREPGPFRTTPSDAQALRPSSSGAQCLARRAPGGLLILGPGQLQGRLDQSAEQHQGELGYRQRLDLPGIDRRGQARLDQAEAVTGLDLVPLLPAEHGRGVEQGDPLDLTLRG